MSAVLLREAAALMRERGEAATPSPWVALGATIGVDLQRCTCGGQPYGHEQHCGLDGPVITGADERDAEHIASWHPAVALAVADWLDMEADLWERSSWYPDSGESLAVARAYLGRQS